ncbi:MAG: hypothetical protein HYR55_20255 [Acidobacteria bacterium]|nr:hypothetical protein [Acidobacteriota bacterium]
MGRSHDSVTESRAAVEAAAGLVGTKTMSILLQGIAGWESHRSVMGWSAAAGGAAGLR